ncbi:MAG: glycosyl hydrolase, partial [candidate division KSB1 bacterium]|nr:glycosyl hydrolase [candidate division KSB1 bacterium]
MAGLFLFLCAAPLLADSLELGFYNPPIEARPKGYWVWTNGNFSLPKLREELKEFKDKGMGGVDIWDVAGWVDENNIIPAGPPFMGDESVQAIAEAVRIGGELGLEMGLTISSSWNAGGSWVKPEHGVMGLFRSTIEVVGPSEVDIKLPFPDLPEQDTKDSRIKPIIIRGPDGLPTFYRDVAVLAMPDRSVLAANDIIDLTKHYRDGRLQWRAPRGRWKIVRYVCTGTGQPLMRPSPNSNGLMIDHFSAEATAEHILFFIRRLEAELGDLSKTALKYLYTDSYEANTAAWTPKLPEEFRQRVGYDLTPYLPVLDGKTVISKEISERFLFDFKKVLSDLIIENHYRLATEICSRYGLGFRAEAGGPGPPVHNCPFESLRSLGVCSVPRGEFWYQHPAGEKHMQELQIVKGPASAAHLYGQPQVEAEAFTSLWMWQRGPGDLKEVADKAMCEGLTRFVYHTTPHIPAEAGLPGWIYNFGTIINTTRVWWPLSRAFHDYLARCCFLLQQGLFVGDVLFYYGDQAPNFVSPKHIPPDLGYGYDYDVCNSDIILNRLTVRDGKLVLPHGQSYRLLVLPNQEAMNPDVLEKIAALVEQGAVVVGPKPKRSHSLANWQENDRRVRLFADKLWKGTMNRFGRGKVYAAGNLRRILLENGILPDVQVHGAASTVLDFIHRQTDDADIYFFRNTTGDEIDVDMTLRVFGRCPQQWNPETGTVRRLQAFQQTAEGVRLPLRLSAWGSTFIILREEKAQAITVQTDGASFPRQEGVKPRRYELFDDHFFTWENGEFALQFK